ncbi:MAG: hypothetical protein ACE5QW_09045 [Thermoplasmata archaeon]
MNECSRILGLTDLFGELNRLVQRRDIQVFKLVALLLLKKMGKVKFEEFAFAAAYGAEKVNDPIALRNLVHIFRKYPMPVAYSLHLRIRKRLMG